MGGREYRGVHRMGGAGLIIRRFAVCVDSENLDPFFVVEVTLSIGEGTPLQKLVNLT